MDEQLYVITVLLIFIMIILLAHLCITAMFLQPVIIHRDIDRDSEYQSV